MGIVWEDYHKGVPCPWGSLESPLTMRSSAVQQFSSLFSIQICCLRSNWAAATSQCGKDGLSGGWEWRYGCFFSPPKRNVQKIWRRRYVVLLNKAKTMKSGENGCWCVAEYDGICRFWARWITTQTWTWFARLPKHRRFVFLVAKCQESIRVPVVLGGNWWLNLIKL